MYQSDLKYSKQSNLMKLRAYKIKIFETETRFHKQTTRFQKQGRLWTNLKIVTKQNLAYMNGLWDSK